MQHRDLLLALLFFILSSSSKFPMMLGAEEAEGIPCVTSEDMNAGSGTCFIKVDKRIELLTAVQLFTSWRETGIFTENYACKRDMLDFLDSCKDHKAADLCEGLITFGFSYDAPVGFMMRLSIDLRRKDEAAFPHRIPCSLSLCSERSS